MMKIQHSHSPAMDRMIQPDRQRAGGDKVPFSEMMKQHKGAMSQEHLTRLMNEINTQGQRLAQSRTVRDLHLYKSLVKRLMDEAVKFGLAFQEKESFGRRRRGRKYKIIEEIDRHLISLTNAILEQEGTHIDLLDRIGEIRGLLVNLYM